MRSLWRWVWLALLASAWGLNEVVADDSLWLAAWALLVLAVARALVNRPGSSALLGLVAVAFKTVNTAPFFCHLAGIALLAVAFDVTATLFLRSERRIALRCAVAGCTAAYLSALLFAVTMTWILPNSPWATGGVDRAYEHVFLSGSRAALAALLLVPLGYGIGQQVRDAAVRRPGWAFGSAAALCAMLWVLGPFVG